MPLMHTHGMFGIPRQVFCYVDYIGALREGPTPSKRNPKQPELAKTWKAVKVLKELFGRVDPNYVATAELLVRGYRHGLVHTFAPKVLRRTDGRQLYWAVYRGGRDESGGGVSFTRHLVISPAPVSAGADYLPISIECLVSDLLSALDLFRAEVEDEHKAGGTALLTKMQQTAAEMTKPDDVTFTW
jgi:hypothetical protein